MHAKDELHSQLRDPAKNVHIPATAYADPARKGTGEHEPMLSTVGKGKALQWLGGASLVVVVPILLAAVKAMRLQSAPTERPSKPAGLCSR